MVALYILYTLPYISIFYTLFILLYIPISAAAPKHFLLWLYELYVCIILL